MKHSITLPGILGLGLAALGATFVGQRSAVPSGELLLELKESVESTREELKSLHVTAGQDLVPFSVEIPGGLANSAAFGSANPAILVDSDGTDGRFVITSMLVRTDVPLTGFYALSVNGVRIDGTPYDTRTENLLAFSGTGVNESADLMGMPVRSGSFGSGDPPTAGNFPHEIVATSGGSSDVRVEFFARSDVDDLEIEFVRVSGWKKRGETISVTYQPGI